MGAVNIYQINQLQKSVNVLSQQVLQMATTTMTLSGLNLAVSAVGFAMLNQKMNLLDQKLNEIQKDVKEIKDFLQMKQRAELSAALRELIKTNNVPLRLRDDILLSSKEILAPISLQYQERLTQATSLQMALIAYTPLSCSACWITCLSNVNGRERIRSKKLHRSPQSFAAVRKGLRTPFGINNN